MTFLGIRCTPGSADIFPPKLNVLIDGFTKLNDFNMVNKLNENSKKKTTPSVLTVGARGLSKHFHRSSEVKYILIIL